MLNINNIINFKYKVELLIKIKITMTLTQNGRHKIRHIDFKNRKIPIIEKQ